LQLQQLVQGVQLLLEEEMAALALQQRVQLVSILVQEPTAATHHTPPEARLRRLRSVVISW
jgi:hypothetical protein